MRDTNQTYKYIYRTLIRKKIGRKGSQENQSKLEQEVRGVENGHLLQDRGTEEREDGEMKMSEERNTC